MQFQLQVYSIGVLTCRTNVIVCLVQRRLPNILERNVLEFMADKIAKAAELKAEGNVLFSKGDFEAANGKYTFAIALDDENPILYANRAQCLLNLKRCNRHFPCGKSELSCADTLMQPRTASR